MPEVQYKNNIFNSVSTNLIICSEKEGWSIFFTNKINVYCHNINYEFNCYTNNTQMLYNKYFCDMCYNNNNKYYIKYNDSNNIDSNINCYYSPEGYYLDDNDSLYKSYYKSCKICNTSGNIIEHNCIECNNDYIIEHQISNF